MIFVIVFSCLSRGPDDQGLSCGPGCESSSGKGLSEAVFKRLNQEKKGGRALARVMRAPLAGEQAMVRAGRLRKADRARFARA